MPAQSSCRVPVLPDHNPARSMRYGCACAILSSEVRFRFEVSSAVQSGMLFAPEAARAGIVDAPRPNPQHASERTTMTKDAQVQEAARRCHVAGP